MCKAKQPYKVNTIMQAEDYSNEEVHLLSPGRKVRILQ